MSDRYLGGFIKAVQSEPTTTAAPGIWTLEQASRYIKAGLWPASPPTEDPYFNQTTLLLHGDGTNGAQNNTFLDSSTNNFTITRNGNTTQGTFSPFSAPDGRWSNYFDGVDDTLISSGTPFSFGAGNFTFEMWIYPLPVGSFAVIVNTNTSGGVGGGITSAGNITIGRALVATDGTTSNSVTFNAWNHVAWVRNSGTVKIYINGIEGFSGSLTYNYPSGALRLGSDNNNTLYYPGYISNVRLSASAVYTSGFTPSTSPLTTSTSPTILTAQSNRFLDNSGNDLTFTTQGAPSVQPFSPFAPSAAYSPSVNGGSGYFGTGNYLTAPDDNFWDLTSSTGSIEMFLYSTATQTNGNGLVGQNSATGDWGGYVYADGKIAIGIQGTSELATAAGNLVNNTWIHVVFTRDNSTSRTRIFVNGALKATGTGTYFAVSSNPLQIINFNDGTNRSFVGYVADIRFCKGSIPTTYQTASTTIDASIFTPPTAPLTVSSQGATSADTELLLNFTNAGIFDNTGKNNLETVADAQIDTTTKKFGTGSMEFDGTGDYLSSPANPELELGSGDFTIECWVNISAAAAYGGIISKGTPGTSNTATWSLEFNASANTISWYVNAASGSYIINGTQNLKNSTWTHVAVTKSGTNTRMFVNGVQDSGTHAFDYTITTGGSLYIGGGYYAPTTRTITGYIDDLRITKGVARYTTTFTPPTAAFPNV